MSQEALALTYAAFILDGQGDAAALEKVLKAAKFDVPASTVKSFSTLLGKKALNDVLKNVSLGGGGGGGGAPAAAAPAAGGAAPKAEAKKAPAKPETESEGEMMDLF